MYKAHRRGLTNESIVVDVGADAMTEARVARGFRHHVISFECRNAQATFLHSRSFVFNDSAVRVVHSCVGDRAGLATLVRAWDSSSMSQVRHYGCAESWSTGDRVHACA